MLWPPASRATVRTSATPREKMASCAAMPVTARTGRRIARFLRGSPGTRYEFPTTICASCNRSWGGLVRSDKPRAVPCGSQHKDAQKGKGKDIGGSGGNFTLRNARVVRQPGDGSCLYHSYAIPVHSARPSTQPPPFRSFVRSLDLQYPGRLPPMISLPAAGATNNRLAYGMGDSASASGLRREIAAWVAANPDLEIADTPVSDWVRWDSNSSVAAYASKMKSGCAAVLPPPIKSSSASWLLMVCTSGTLCWTSCH